MRFPDFRTQDLVFMLVSLWVASYLFSYVGNVVTYTQFRGQQAQPAQNVQNGAAKSVAVVSDSRQCEEATGDWKLICTRSVTSPEGVSTSQRILVSKAPHEPEVVVPNHGPVPTASEVRAYSMAVSRYSSQLDLNTASEARIMRLPGIDKVLARRIATAALNEPFTSVDDVLRVEGMNEKRLKAIRSRVRAGTDAEPKLEQFVAAR